jgi:alkanesulfonate monooxygenase SsuD/methylene tetrahydromethanopterin reductase-like flavin-dependent oxidoreductase (luciferase family)
MFIGYFTERPYQDREADWYQASGVGLLDLTLSNGVIDADVQADLYHRYFDEKLYIEEMGFDGVMLNSHHSTPFCMGGGPMNLEAAVLARITKKLKIILLGNVLPIWDDPMYLVEELAMIDVLSRGRLVSGWVRGTGRESVAHNAQPPYNWERFLEAHEFIKKAWTEDGPFRFEGEHYQYRYVNPWVRPYTKPHPRIWLAGIMSKATIDFAVENRYPYVMLDSKLELTAQVFDYYKQKAREHGYESGPQNLGYMFKVCIEETEEKAYETGRKLIEGAGNLFLDGSQGHANPWAQNLPGLNTRKASGYLPTAQYVHNIESRGLNLKGESIDFTSQAAESPEEHEFRRRQIYDGLLERHAIVVGTPETALKRVRHVLETLRPGNVIFWHGDGDFTHEDTMRGLKLMGEEFLPGIREIGAELGLEGAWEADPNGIDVAEHAAEVAPTT